VPALYERAWNAGVLGFCCRENVAVDLLANSEGGRILYRALKALLESLGIPGFRTSLFVFHGQGSYDTALVVAKQKNRALKLLRFSSDHRQRTESHTVRHSELSIMQSGGLETR